LPGRPQHDTRLLASLATVVAVLSFVAFQQRDQVLLSGDAVAHIGIARRVFDSLTPGPFQLGTVWLPFQHLLTIPFLVSDEMWRSGVGGSIPSMLGYVLAVVGIFRLTRSVLESSVLARYARPAAWFSATVLAANPNLIYVQATALNEALYLAGFIWGVAFLADFARLSSEEQVADAARALERCAMVLAAAILTRYDGWFLTIACGLAVLGVLWTRPGWSALLRPRQRRMRRALIHFVLLCSLTPGLWMAYNFGIFRDPLEFARGPYSARAIMQRTIRPGEPFHPGYQSPRVAAIYFLKCAKLNMAEGRWEPWLLLLAVGGALVSILARRWVWVLLWLPLPFYALSVAYGAVPIFIPAWWPFSYYNTRYGLQLLPAIAAFSAVCLAFLLTMNEQRRWKIAVPVILAAVVVGSYASVWSATPVCLREVIANSRTRIPYEKALSRELEKLPPTARLLMFTGEHIDALRRAGIPLRRVVNESNFGYWQPALDDLTEHVDYVIAMEGGPVGASAERHRSELETVAVITSLGQPRTTIYKTHPPIAR